MDSNTLDELNDKKASVYVLPIAYVAVVMVCGILGNSVVLIVYTFKIRRPSNYRLFVLTLAILDLIASITGIPGLITDLSLPYEFYSSIACKLLRYGYHVIACASSMTHFLIGIERHRKICGPLKTQMSQTIAKLLLTFIIVLALVIAIPAFFIYGKHTFIIDEYNITVFQCQVQNNYIHTSYPLGYDITLLVLVISTVLGLAVCYIHIGRKLLKTSVHVSPNTASRQTRPDVVRNIEMIKAKNLSETAQTETELQPYDNPSQIAMENTVDNEEEHKHTTFKLSSYNKRSVCNDRNNLNKNTKSENIKQHSYMKTYATRQLSMESKSHKITAITFVLTVTFSVSYLPYLICAIAAAVKADIRDSMTATEEAWYQVGIMSYILNNAANPFVYFMMDKVFRKQCQRIVCCFCNGSGSNEAVA